MGIKFTKMHGCGNDFIIIDYDEFKKSGMEMQMFVQKICDRNFGVGADGLIIPDTNCTDADIGWHFYNSDGTGAQMCGNGMRCFVKYICDKNNNGKKELRVKTAAGVIHSKILADGRIRVNMSKPVLLNTNINCKITTRDRIFYGMSISMGNPHFVIFVAGADNISQLAETYGAFIAHQTLFTEVPNVSFAKIVSSSKIELCTFERGCGKTFACGTGACAGVVAGILNGLLTNNVTVKLPGGEVNVEWNGTKQQPEQDVFLSGPAEYVFTGELCGDATL